MLTKRTANTENQLSIPVDDLKLGADDDMSTLATQETMAKNLVYIMNIPEDKLGAPKHVRDSSKNPGDQDDKKCSPLEKSNPVTSNDNLNAYRESDRDNNLEKGKNVKRIPGVCRKLYIWNSKWMMTWQNNRRTLMMRRWKGKSESKKGQYIIMNLVVKKKKESMPTQKN